MIFTWIISSLIFGEIILFLAMLRFRDQSKVSVYPPGWFYFALTLGMFVAANTSLFAYVDTLHRTERLRAVIARRIEVNSLMRAVYEMESSQRGFLLTKRETYLEPYRSASVVIASRMEAVRAIYSGLPDEPYAETLCRAASLKVTEMEDVLTTYRTDTLGKALEVVQTDTGKNLMALFKESYDDILRRNLDNYERERSGVEVVARARILMATLLILGSVVQMVLGAYRHYVPHDEHEVDVAGAVKAMSGLDLPMPEPRQS